MPARVQPQISIRPETAADRAAIRDVNVAAFGRGDEADLVDALRADGDVLLSAVAETDARVVGHVLFSRMWIDTATSIVDAVALAPVAVLPRYQRGGIGGLLIRYGLDVLRESGERIAIVVGHAEYCPRFGFSSRDAAGLEHPFPAGVFMVRVLHPDALQGVSGRVRYPPAFGL